ncbi:hypothetical protein LTR48_000942 [Friedmanniomyces endolithicus]|uniref:SUZ domain-containing protein n=1 Tax=Rachicladosporium monterosium TaxID=1507873 RepID=A0ABR0LEQ6_9PEZI|nr:hypothetical protein LTR48_000942 [Friedmanniomyces endolithicus]KAK5147693.1 hypothetical protein LTR32_000898 [Rachicladosporium monterosium]
MPEGARRIPQPAQVEDCLSDESSAKPGTARQAKRRPLSIKTPKVVQKRADSDSGYSSHTGTITQAQTLVATAGLARHAANVSPTKSRPVVHRSESESVRTRASSRSASTSKHCTDPACTDSGCLSKRNPERRYTMSQPIDSVQYAAAMAQYQQQARAQQIPPAQKALPSARQYQYAPQYVQTPMMSPVVPVIVPQPRPRATSTSRPARPASMYGSVSYSGQPQQRGPPPSPSAYQSQFPAYYQQYPQPSIYGTTPPNQTLPSYPPQSPIIPSPTSMPYAVPPVLARTYSTREVSSPIASYGVPKTVAQLPLTQTISARQATSMPGTFPEPESDETDSELASQSETDSEVERQEHRQRERERERRDRERRGRAGDSDLMPPPTRRPSIRKRDIAPAAPVRTPSEPRRRVPRPTPEVDYPSSSEYVDSDRTARAVVERPRARTNSSYSGRSRHPSVSTTASSGRTKATTVSSGSGSHKYIIEDRNGRRKEYLSKEQYKELIRRYEVQKNEDQEMQERAEAYQNQIRGRQPPELTAENIRKAERRTSGSHISGQSRKSSTRSSSKTPKNDGIKIQSGDTVLHVYGDARVEMRQSEDGTPAFIIGSTSGSARDSAYHGSKSSGSQARRRKDTITEEDDGYEKAL